MENSQVEILQVAEVRPHIEKVDSRQETGNVNTTPFSNVEIVNIDVALSDDGYNRIEEQVCLNNHEQGSGYEIEGVAPKGASDLSEMKSPIDYETYEVQHIERSVPGNPGTAINLNIPHPSISTDGSRSQDSVILEKAEGVGEVPIMSDKGDQIFKDQPVIKIEMPKSIRAAQKPKGLTLLEQLLINEQIITSAAAGDIVFSPALLTRNGVVSVRRGTINTIQGAEGSHKSRLAAMLATLFLSKPGYYPDTLGFAKVENEKCTVVYIDTERNLQEEFAEAVQTMRLNAGYEVDEDMPDFRVTSLKNMERSKRLRSIRDFIEKVKKDSLNDLVVIVDVVTDCVNNINDNAECMQLYDYVGNLCEQFGATFILVIHENPGSMKARGHIGTEALNKASCAIRIGSEKNNTTERTELFWVTELKNRNAKRAHPFAVQFSDITKSLELANPDLVQMALKQKRLKSDVTAISEKLVSHLSSPLVQQNLVELLTKDVKFSRNTIIKHLNTIAEDEVVIKDSNGACFILEINRVVGKTTTYELLEVAESS